MTRARPATARGRPAATRARRVDRRVQRSQRALREALMALIVERGWERVSVTDVCARADVGRSTFYAHYGDLEELLVTGLDELRAALRAQAAADGGQPLGFVRPLLEHARGHWRLMQALVGRRSGHVVQRRFLEVVIELLEPDVARCAPPSAPRDATARYLAGAFVELLAWWLDARKALTAAEVDALFRALTAPVLAALQRMA